MNLIKAFCSRSIHLNLDFTHLVHSRNLQWNKLKSSLCFFIQSQIPITLFWGKPPWLSLQGSKKEKCFPGLKVGSPLLNETHICRVFTAFQKFPCHASITGRAKDVLPRSRSSVWDLILPQFPLTRATTSHWSSFDLIWTILIAALLLSKLVSWCIWALEHPCQFPFLSSCLHPATQKPGCSCCSSNCFPAAPCVALGTQLKPPEAFYFSFTSSPYHQPAPHITNHPHFFSAFISVLSFRVTVLLWGFSHQENATSCKMSPST